MSTTGNGLQIHADDLGMSPPVNAGIFRAFDTGALSSASIMAPTPAFEAAARGVCERGLPCAVHLTLASEWNRLRWGPLTGAALLCEADGCFPLHVRSLDGGGKELREAVEAEFTAQIERVLDAGIRPTHLDAHIEVFDPSIQARLCDRFGLKSRDPLDHRPDLGLGHDQLVHLTPRGLGEKRNLLAQLGRETRNHPDRVCVLTHPAEHTLELEAMCHREPGFEDRHRWAVDYRVSDLVVLLERNRFGSAMAEGSG